MIKFEVQWLYLIFFGECMKYDNNGCWRGGRVDPAPPAPRGELLVTDWIPCTELPVRDGDYEIEFIGGNGLQNFGPTMWRATFKGGKFFDCKYGEEMDDITRGPERYRWRGVRRWVLVRRADPLMTAINRGDPVDVYLIDARPRRSKFGGLQSARPFRDKADAERFAARYSQLGLTAVLP